MDDDEFVRFVEEVGSRVQLALAASFDGSVGQDAFGDTVLYLWEQR